MGIESRLSYTTIRVFTNLANWNPLRKILIHGEVTLNFFKDSQLKLWYLLLNKYGTLYLHL